MSNLIVTTPIRPIPTDFPPIGSLSIVSYLRRHGIDDIEFYNIDGNRPEFDEAVDYIVEFAPRVLGISSVVSTAYEYTKKLSLAVKERRPETLIVCGGNLAASSEILLRRTGADICVLGEGEQVFFDIVKRAETSVDPLDFKDVPGLMLIDENDSLINTGYPAPLDKSEIYDIDWEILEHASDIDHFFIDMTKDDRAFARFIRESRAQEEHRQGKRFAMVPAAKGCVAKCTFCHRWDKGIRYIPVDLFVERLRQFTERYNIGFISIADENFGTDRRWLKEFCEKIKTLDLLWYVGGMRVNCVNPETIAMMKDAGCTGILFGMETGSPRMLQIMEKKTKQEDNENAMRWTIEAGIPTIVQLVIGMPGETSETIGETIEFCQTAMTLDPSQNPNDLSINYAQALPGTPLYEFGRHKNLIGQDLDGEEAYLLQISDKDAHDEFSTINFTDVPILEHQSWRPRITVETNYAFVKKYGQAHYRSILLEDAKFFEQETKDLGYFANPKRLVDTSVATDTIHGTQETYTLKEGSTNVPGLLSLLRQRKFGLAMICYPILFYRLRAFLPFLVFAKNLSRAPLKYNLKNLWDFTVAKIGLGGRAGKFKHGYQSLRKIVNVELGDLPGDDAMTIPLRKGR